MKKHNAIADVLIPSTIGREFAAISRKLGFSPRERAELERLYARFVDDSIASPRRPREDR